MFGACFEIIVSVQVIQESMLAYTTAVRTEWVINWPGQAVLCASQKYWTQYVHESIRSGQQVSRSFLIYAVH